MEKEMKCSNCGWNETQEWGTPIYPCPMCIMGMME